MWNFVQNPVPDLQPRTEEVLYGIQSGIEVSFSLDSNQRFFDDRFRGTAG